VADEERYLFVSGASLGSNGLQLYIGDGFVRFRVLANGQILASMIPLSDVSQIVSHLQKALDGGTNGS